MKKIGKLLMAFILAFGVCFIVSCDEKSKEPDTPPVETPTKKKSISSLQLNTSDVKKTYYIGESFSSDKLGANARFSDGTLEDVSSTVEIDYSSFDSTTVGTYPIIVSYTYEGRVKRNSYDVKVTSLVDDIEKHIIGLDVSKTTTAYKTKEELTTDDIKVSILYSDSTTLDLTSDKFVIDSSSVNMNKANIYPLVISYSETYTLDEAEETFTVKNFILITVNDTLLSIEFVSGTTVFDFGGKVDTSDWTFKALYESGDQAELTTEKMSVAKIDTFKSGEKNVKVSYTEMGVYKAVQVKVLIKDNPQPDYTINKFIDASQLTTDTGVEITSKHKQDLLPSEVDDFFTISGTLVKYLDSAHTTVRSIEALPGNSISFTVTGITKLTLSACSNGASNTSLLSVIDSEGNLLEAFNDGILTTSEGFISIKGSSGSETTVVFSLKPGTYTISFVSAIDDSANKDIPETVSRAGRITSLVLNA